MVVVSTSLGARRVTTSWLESFVLSRKALTEVEKIPPTAVSTRNNLTVEIIDFNPGNDLLLARIEVQSHNGGLPIERASIV